MPSEAARNVPELAPVVKFIEFTAEEVGTSENGMNTIVVANKEETMLLPMNEPVYGTKRKSQVETFLEHNEGAGVQHLALMTHDIFFTLKEMRKRSGMGGFEFMPPPLPTYYHNLKNRVSDVLTDDQIRPTLFIEIIQRIGCMLKDKEGKEYQKGGCGGFGKGNVSELFKSVEEYEKTLATR